VNTHEIRLGEADRCSLANGADRCAFDPYRSFDPFLREAAASFQSLSDGVRDAVGAFVAGSTSSSTLLIDGVPEDPALPPTPTHDDGSRYTTSTVSEFTLCAIASAAGEPVGYAPERWGQLVHNVFPTAGELIPSQRFRTGLGFHSELSCHHESPDFVLLLCLRQDPEREAITWVLDIRTLLNELPDPIVDALFRPEFALDLGKLHYVYLSEGKRISNRPEHRPVISIFSGDRSDPAVRYEPALMTPLTDRAREAFDYLADVAPSMATPLVLTPGSALLIDNRRTLHARSSFRAGFDGNDRWIRRMMIASGPRGRALAAAGRIIDADLLVGWSDRPTVTSLASAS
jgi:L-asparagine oxygenase